MILAFPIPVRSGLSDGGRRPFAHTVHGDDRRILVRGTEEGAGSVAQMVFYEQ